MGEALSDGCGCRLVAAIVAFIGVFSNPGMSLKGPEFR
jgi:hypothetical protein